MFSTGLIVFRETLEAALFIGIIAAATRHIPQRNQSIVIGILLGIAGAIALALGIGVINDMADGTGQDWLHILILCTAFLMLLWHVLYASEHGRELAQKARTMGTQVHLGKTSLMAITIAIALMVLREGTETVLFVSGSLSAPQQHSVTTEAPATNIPAHVQTQLTATLDLTAANQPSQPNNPELASTLDLTQSNTHHQHAKTNNEATLTPSQNAPLTQKETQKPTQRTTPETTPRPSTTDPRNTQNATAASAPQSVAPATVHQHTDIIMGGAAGLALGILVGGILYFGLARIPLARMFSITNGLIILIAAGMAGHIGKRLSQLGLIPDSGQAIWDSSAVLPDEHPIGLFLNALIGYESQPTLTHITFFLIALTGIAWLQYLRTPSTPKAHPK